MSVSMSENEADVKMGYKKLGEIFVITFSWEENYAQNVAKAIVNRLLKYNYWFEYYSQFKFAMQVAKMLEDEQITFNCGEFYPENPGALDTKAMEKLIEQTF